jgi:nucleosome binding factor SPN SPT16 subunit
MLVTGHVPFHVAMIRNIICQAEEKKFYTIRIQFQVPGTLGFGYKTECNPFPEISGPNGMFIKEFIFRSSHRMFIKQ